MFWLDFTTVINIFIRSLDCSRLEIRTEDVKTSCRRQDPISRRVSDTRRKACLGMNVSREMQLSIRELISDAVRRRANKYTFYTSKETPLDIAVQTCNVKFLDIFLDCVDLDEQVKIRMVSNAYNKLFYCDFSPITKDHVSMVKRLLELGADVNGGSSVSPLSVAAKTGSYPMVELLCQHGAYLNKKKKKFQYLPNEVLYYSPVDLALVYGHTDCAKLLLQHGVNFDVGGVLYSLIYHQSVACVNFLLEYCRHETQQYICKHQQKLLLSAVRRKNVEFISRIFDIVFDITGKYPYWGGMLVESGNGEIASFLIWKGADVNKLVETYGGYTPLYLVLGREDMCLASKLQVVKVLLENGASPNIHGGTSPLMLAALTINSTDLLQLLLDYGADINWTDNKGDTVLSYSVYQGCASNAEFLITYAKDQYFVNSQNNEGLTVLMQAARYRNVAVVKGVINHNPDINLTDNNGNTALLHAINRAADCGIVTTLINAGCDVNLQNDDGLSPLMLAASRYSIEIIQILLDAGADINAVNKIDSKKTAVSYFQPLSYIHDKYITACLEVFLAQGASLSYLQPKLVHRILLCNDSDTICKFITNGTGPITLRSDEYFNYFSRIYPTIDISPLCTALLRGNVSLARHFVDIMWLTKSDLTSIMRNKPGRSYLEKENHTLGLNLFGEMSSQPMSLFRLAFVEVSSAVGTTPGRENRVNKLPLPQMMKDKLLFRSDVDFTIPTMDRVSFWQLPFDPYSKIYIRVLDCCKCCRVWQNLKLQSQFRKEYHDSLSYMYKHSLTVNV